MNSCSPQLPLIYLADKTLTPGDSKWAEVRSDVRKALEEYGCFEATYDKVSWELQESFVKTIEELFALPVEAKKRNVCPKPYVGYFCPNDLIESFGIQDVNILENVNEFTQQLLPNGDVDESISKTIQLFAENMVEIDVMVRKMVMESFGIEKYIDEHLNSTSYRMRLLKYVAPSDVDAATTANGDASTDASVNANVTSNVDGDADAKTGATPDAGDDDNDGAHADDTKLGLPSHTDKHLLTVLFQHQIEGLEVKTKDEKWIRVTPSPNTFVVLAGDSLCAFMNGRIRAPYHRVRVTEKKKTRYTAAIFTCPKPGYIIEAPKELVDEKHPRLFKPFDFRDFFTFYHTEAGRMFHSTLQAFCAVSEA